MAAVRASDNSAVDRTMVINSLPVFFLFQEFV